MFIFDELIRDFKPFFYGLCLSLQFCDNGARGCHKGVDYWWCLVATNQTNPLGVHKEGVINTGARG